MVFDGGVRAVAEAVAGLLAATFGTAQGEADKPDRSLPENPI
jgi:hypothetical protein